MLPIYRYPFIGQHTHGHRNQVKILCPCLLFSDRLEEWPRLLVRLTITKLIQAVSHHFRCCAHLDGSECALAEQQVFAHKPPARRNSRLCIPTPHFGYSQFTNRRSTRFITVTHRLGWWRGCFGESASGYFVSRPVTVACCKDAA